MDVMRTGFYLNPFVNRVLIKKNFAKQKINPTLTSEIVLSDREKEVLTLVCMEFTASEISQKMSISARTVEAIKDRLMERFGVKNSVGLVFFAMKNQLID
jgi:DNA-binding NarL/FixJ family response regulator